MCPFQNGSFTSGILNKSTELGESESNLIIFDPYLSVETFCWFVVDSFFSLFAIMTPKYKKYRNALERKGNKKSKWKLLTSTYVILIYNIIACNLHY